MHTTQGACPDKTTPSCTLVSPGKRSFIVFCLFGAPGVSCGSMQRLALWRAASLAAAQGLAALRHAESSFPSQGLEPHPLH